MFELKIGDEIKINDPIIHALLYKYGKKDMSLVRDIERTFKDRLEIIEERDRILAALIGDSEPVKSIMRRYDVFGDNDMFVAALASALLMRHRQWQANRAIIFANPAQRAMSRDH